MSLEITFLANIFLGNFFDQFRIDKLNLVHLFTVERKNFKIKLEKLEIERPFYICISGSIRFSHKRSLFDSITVLASLFLVKMSAFWCSNEYISTFVSASNIYKASNRFFKTYWLINRPIYARISLGFITTFISSLPCMNFFWYSFITFLNFCTGSLVKWGVKIYTWHNEFDKFIKKVKNAWDLKNLTSILCKSLQ